MREYCSAIEFRVIPSRVVYSTFINNILYFMARTYTRDFVYYESASLKTQSDVKFINFSFLIAVLCYWFLYCKSSNFALTVVCVRGY